MGQSADEESIPSEPLARRALDSFDQSAADVPAADLSGHLALVSDDADRHASSAFQFVRSGLAAGERVLYFAGERDRAAVEAAMCDSGIDVDAHVDAGSLTVLSTAGSELPPDPEAVLDRIERTVASDAGEYDAVRVVTEASRAFGGDTDAVADYEQGLSAVCEDDPVIALCGYLRDRLPPEFVRDAIRAHPLVVTGGSVARNVYYTPPSVIWDGDSPEQAVDRMLDTLQSAAEQGDDRPGRVDLLSVLSAGGVRLLGLDHASQTVTVQPLRVESLLGEGVPGDLSLDTFLQYVHPDDRGRVADTFQSPEPETDWAVEFRVVGLDEGERWVAAHGEHVQEGDRPSSIGVLRDITEHKRLQRELRTEREHFRVALENSPFTAFRLDTDLRYTWVGNPHADFDESAVLGKRDDELLPPEPAEKIMAPKRRALETGEGVREEITYELPSGRVTYDLTVEPLRDEAGEVVGLTAAAIDLTDRKRLERMLSRLHEASRDLIRADSVVDAAERTVDAAVDALDIDTVAVYRFDETDNRLRRAATTPALAERCDSLPALASSIQSVAWASFLDGEAVTRGDLTDVEADLDGAFQSGLWIPLGDHGVLAVLSPAKALDERVRQAADHLAATAEATLDRIDHADTLRAQEQALAAKTRRLDRLRRLNDIVRDIDQALLGASTTAEIAEAVCERLTRTDRFRFAWLGERTGPRVTARAWAGATPGYLDEVSLATDGESLEPAAETAVSGAVTHEGNVADDLRADPWRRRALSHGLQSVLSVPVEYDGVQYGVITVYTDTPGTLDALSRAVLAELGDTVGNAMNAVETRQALHSDSVVELRLTIDDPADPLARLATATGATVTVTGAVPKQSDRTRVFATVTGVDADEFEQVATEAADVARVGRLDESVEADANRFELVVLGQTMPATLVTLGAVSKSITIADGATSAVVELPRSLSVRTFVDRLEATDAAVELEARRDTERADPSGQVFETLLTDEMTDRQREVLKTAYLSGYFEWPRDRTGEEVAASLDITQSTFNNHLRTAERKLLSRLFD